MATFSIEQLLHYIHCVFKFNVIYIFMYNVYKAHYSQFDMLWRAMYEKKCAMDACLKYLISSKIPLVVATLSNLFTG